MTTVMPSISANELTAIIKADRSAFDHSGSPTSISRYFERTTQKRVSFSSLILAMLHAGFAVSPYGHSFRFTPMFTAEGAVQ